MCWVSWSFIVPRLVISSPAPNAAPGLFAGWRLEPGCAYKGVGLVLDVAKLKNRAGAWTDPLPVPEQEIYVKDEAPGFH